MTASMGSAERLLLRLALPDRPGGLAAVAGALGAHGVNIHRVEVVEAGTDVVVDDLLVEGGDIAAALAALEEDVEVLGRRQHAELPDPALAMADAVAGISGAATLGAARDALLRASLDLMSSDAGVLLRDAGHGWLRPVASSVDSLPPIRNTHRALARDVLTRSRAAVVAPGEEWAPPPYESALGAGRVLVAPAGTPPFLALAVVRHDGFPFLNAEIERVQALLRVGVGILLALGERVVQAPNPVSARVSGVRR